MPSNWDEIKLGEIADFRNGLNFTKESFGKGVKVIGVKDFQDYSVPRYDEIEEINPDGVVKESDLLKQGDILFVRSNGNRQLIGRSLFINKVDEPISHSAFTIRVRFISANTDPKYYAFLFRSRLIRDVLSAYGGGTNISNLNQQILNGLIVPIPPLSTQRRIADILSAYDDLIENNTRRIKNLEQTAKAIYQEWFMKVNKDSLPDNWKLDILGNHITVDRGVSHKGEFMNGDGLPLLSLKSFLADGGYRTDGLKSYSGDYKTKHVVHSGDVVLANTDLTQAGSIVGNPVIVPNIKGEILFTHHLYAVRLKSDSCLQKYFLYHLLRDDSYKSFAKGRAIGTTVLGLSQDGVLDFEFTLPPKNLIQKFEAVVSPIYSLKDNLEAKNANLRQTRDLLLPRLVSGEIEVSTLS